METYTPKEPETNIEYFFDIPNNVVLSHAVFLDYDDNSNVIFLNIDTKEPTVISKKQFSYFYNNYLVKTLPSSVSYKQQWFFLMSYYNDNPGAQEKIKDKSDGIRLFRAFKQLSENQKIELMETAESQIVCSTLSKTEKKLLSYFKSLEKTEQEGILAQVKFLHDKESKLIKK